MEYGFISHVLLWLVGVIAVGGLVGTVAAFWSMGRSGYRND